MKTARIVLFCILSIPVWAQPVPGDLFKEYKWVPREQLEGDSFLRVGGKLSYKQNATYQEKGIVSDEGYLRFPHKIDLQSAVKAEWVLERIQSHEGTTGLTIQLNNGMPRKVNFPKIVSEERAVDFMVHNYPKVSVPISELQEQNNLFRLSVDSIQNWAWPQNIFYGLKLRVYYESPYGANDFDFSVSQESDSLIRLVPPKVLFGRSVDYLHAAEDINWEGDGNYIQWHYHDHQGLIKHHIGSSIDGIVWDTSWIPDQAMVRLGAFVHLDAGFIFFAALGSVDIQHDSYEVKLLKPYDLPAFWSTRSGEFKESFDLERAESLIGAKMYWTSWSPCYSNGVFINGHLVSDGRGPCYDYYAHEVDIEHLEVLETGENILSTGLTPLFRGQMVHGMEVQYPGIMLKVKHKR